MTEINKDLVKIDYLQGMKYKDIAKKFGVAIDTVKSWVKRYGWAKDKKRVHTKAEKRCTQSKNSAKVGTQIKDDSTESEEIIHIENTKLTDKQKLFCTYYIKYRNKTKAYMKAYQCSYDNASAHAYEMWKKVDIRNEIERQLKELRDNIGLDTQDIIQKYIDIAFADITDYVEFGQEEVPVMGAFGPITVEDENGEEKELTKIVNVVKFKESREIDGTIISEVKQGRDGASIKLYDKMKALEWLSARMDLLPVETQEKLKIEQRKMDLLEKQSDDLDDDIIYEDVEDENEENQED